MKFLRRLVSRIAAAFSIHREDRRFSSEFDTHIDLLTQENIRAGMEPAEAHRQAALKFGTPSLALETCREQRGLPRLEAFTRDLRHAFRALRKAPGFSLSVVLTLAIALGANTAIFSLVNQALLHPNGIDHPERIISIREHYGKLLNLTDLGATSGPVFAAIRAERSLFEHTAALSGLYLTYTGGSRPEHLQAAQVSSEWFDVLGAKPLLGRTFTPEEDQPNVGRVAVLSYSTWTKRFGADPSVLGRTIELDLQPWTIIGVMKPGIEWLGEADLWLPLALSSADIGPQENFHQHLFVLARLRPGLLQAQANAWLRLFSSRVLTSGVPGAKDTASLDWYIFPKSFVNAAIGDTRTPTLLLLAAVGIVLLIASANIAGLMLARNAMRSNELALQAALGASRGRLLGRVAAESLLLAGFGTAAGLGLAWIGMRTLLLWVPKTELPRGLNAQLDIYTLAFTAAAVAITGVLFGILPAWQSSAVSFAASANAGSRIVSARQKTRSTLVVLEAALALVLMVGAGALLRSFIQLEQVHPGFDARRVMTASISFPASRYNNPQTQSAFYQAMLDRLPADSAIASDVPFSGGINSGGFEIRGRTSSNGPPTHADVRYVSPAFFDALHIPLKRGRAFSAVDRIGTECAVIIDANMAGQFWPGEDPIGKQLRPIGLSRWCTIVGVAGHILQSDLALDSGRGTLYYALYQIPRIFPVASIVTHGSTDAIRAAVASADPSEAIFDTKSLADRVAGSLGSRRFLLQMMASFAIVALFLSALGLYGVISYAVGQRRREIGVRMALGAQRVAVSRMIVAEGLRLALIGVALGLAIAAGLAHTIESQLYEARVFDMRTVSIAVTILVAVAVAASFFPARRAASVDPMSALRCE